MRWCIIMINEKELYKLYVKEGKTQTEIGKLYNCDRKNVDYYLKKYNIPKQNNRKKKFNLNAKEIMELINKGMLVTDIAKHYNVSRGTVGRVLNETGINLRNHKAARNKQSEFMKENNPFNDATIKQKALRNSKVFKDKELKMNRAQLRLFDNSMTYKQYAKKARYLAYYYYKKGAVIPDSMVIDHIYSVKDGYKNKVPLAYISHPFNLRLISNEENIKKSHNSLITLNELYNGVVFND